ncbi:MAG TPA: hypothetical protein VFE47_25155 [Tepidisphaeraceae bacterium]|jgi:hypothetical protein|nr:hypothetical protein [Tepidisphaeraceae bacterium]
MLARSLLILSILCSAAMAGDSPPAAESPAVPLPPTLVTLHVKDASVSSALAKILESAHESLPPSTVDFLDANVTKKITLDCDKTPFWEAVRQVCEQAEVSFSWEDAGLQIMPDHGQWAGRPHVVSGPFMVQALETMVIAGGKLGREPTYDTPLCNLELAVLAEPGTSAIRVNAIDIKEVGDDGGYAIDLPRFPSPFYPQFRNHSCQAVIHLQPDPSAKAIASIKGDISIVVETSSAMATFSDLGASAEAEQQVGPLKCAMKSTLVESSCELHIEFTDPRKDAAEWEMTWKNLRTTRPVLIDASGRAFSYGGNNCSGSLFTDLSTHRFVWKSPEGVKDRPKLPLKLTWRVPTEARIVKVPFAFKNLALPKLGTKQK